MGWVIWENKKAQEDIFQSFPRLSIGLQYITAVLPRFSLTGVLYHKTQYLSRFQWFLSVVFGAVWQGYTAFSGDVYMAVIVSIQLLVTAVCGIQKGL